MSISKDDLEHFFSGLKALSASSFPKVCPSCKHVYHSAQEYVEMTKSIQGKSGLKESEDDDGTPILEVFRNCHCGSTLLDFFQDRRDSPDQRVLFGRLLDQLCAEGIERDSARQELIKIKHGLDSSIIEQVITRLKN